MTTSRPTVLWAAAYLFLALTFASTGLWAIATIGWTEIYADQWRSYSLYLELPFPSNVLTLENGHRPIFPGLIRVAEMHWFSGNQLLQLTTGALFAFATVLVLANCAWRDRGTGIFTRSIAVAIAAFAVFWLGNARMLLHGNESMHAYLLTACAAGAITLVMKESMDWRALLLACALAFVATFSFGAGLAVFPALTLLLIVQRRYRSAVWIVGALAFTLVVYLVLPSGTGVRNSLTLQPLANMLTAATWLASMPVNLFLSALEPSAGRSLPGPLYALMNPTALAYEARFGSIHTHHSPATALGLLALVVLAWTTLRTWRNSERATNLRLAGIGLAWFSVGVAGIVAIGRLSYFESHPAQIFANRYLPWSCLFWLGLFWILLGRHRSDDATVHRATIFVASVVLIFGLLTSVGHRAWGVLVHDGIALDSAGFATGLMEAGRDRYGEGYAEDIETTLPMIRDAGLSMFSWPESKRLNSQLPPLDEYDSQATIEIEASRTLTNRLSPDPYLFLQIRIAPYGTEPLSNRLLLLDQDHRAVGLLVRRKSQSPGSYHGYAAGVLEPRHLIITDLEGRFRQSLLPADR